MKTRTSGFTLIEILIVVIILGILAAIVIPQFTEASSEARESSLVSNLQTLRSQIGLYKVQHNDEYPGYTDGDGDGAPDDFADFEADLIGQTDVDGAVGTDFGPYMQAIPNNPFITVDGIQKFDIGSGVSPGSDSSHWWVDEVTGNVWANDSQDTPDGSTPHSEL